jgi:cyanophycinase
VAPGPLALVGGDELKPGNEPQDRILVEAAGDGPAYMIATAAARQRPDLAVANAQRWFGELGLEIVELPLTKRSHATSPEIAAMARSGRFFYLVGGDPGLVPKVLADSPVWSAIVDAWRDGAALAGSSAGAMAMGAWTLIRDRMPGDDRRRYRDALGLVPNVAVVPHLSTFGERWIPSALEAAPEEAVLLGIDEQTAAVFLDGSWRVEGPRTVSVISRGQRETFVSGAPIRGLPDPGRGSG